MKVNRIKERLKLAQDTKLRLLELITKQTAYLSVKKSDLEALNFKISTYQELINNINKNNSKENK